VVFNVPSFGEYGLLPPEISLVQVYDLTCENPRKEETAVYGTEAELMGT